MSKERKIAIAVGMLFIVATIAGILSLAISEPIMSGDDYLSTMSEHGIQIKIGLIFELIMGLSVAAISIIIFPVLKKYNNGLAIAYVGSRIIEALFYFIDIVMILTLFSLSHQFVGSGAPADSYFQTIAELILKARDWSGHVVLDIGVFGVAGLILYYTLLKSKLLPRWISIWGLLSIVMYIAAAYLVMFGVKPLSPILVALSIPLALNELVMAIWLIAKGFNKEALISLEKTN